MNVPDSWKPQEAEQVIFVPFSTLYAYLEKQWRQGEHVSILGATGQGKSYLERAILPIRNGAVCFCDIKGDDSTIRRMPGFRRIGSWPADVDMGFRLRLAPFEADGVKLMQRQQREFKRCLNDIFTAGKWTVVLDELRIMADAPGKTSHGVGLGLKSEIERLYLYGRSRKITVIGGTQAPRWIPKACYDQPRHLFMFQILDTQAQLRFAEVGGRTQLLKKLIPMLEDHEFLYINVPSKVYVRSMVGT